MLIGAAVSTALMTAGCGHSGASGSTGPGATGELVVMAAASLTESFDQLRSGFEARNPQVEVAISYGGSSGLAQQITSGAPADVFAAASPATMQTVVDAGDANGEPAVFARNQLVIATAKGNPKGIRTLADLKNPDLKVALCAEQVPCGAAAKKAGVDVEPVTLEQDVKAALSKLKLGEVDAALVYRTDARSASGDVDAVEFPESTGAINDYPIVALRHAPNPSAAAAFVAFVRSEEAQRVLADAGFQRP
ncbi:molybdate transport system substrate-binding protein [Paractinoplanes brasiliensis]|uniref:Molybdate transport system substrate-binding protein n=1 Tax=Paractinoplanes brasiliensis TaxID=52695 RepID=A0A4R6JWH0_9ACTN|nr:molybdate transport system substrate-binding protein [Actinoplanes brasiliensis]GID26190.1 molybdate-binding protein [Actinoplanes brasiliensis]